MVSNHLLDITTGDTVLQANIRDGRLQNPHAPDPLIQQNTIPGGLEVNTTPSKLNVDTYDARASMGYGQYNDADLIKHVVAEAKQSCADMTRRSVQKGDALLQKVTPAEYSRRQTQEKQQINTQIAFYPGENARVSFDKGGVEIDYRMTDPNISWKNLQIEPLDFERGSVTFSIAQKAYCDIQYLGSPTFFPESANPDIKFSAKV